MNLRRFFLPLLIAMQSCAPDMAHADVKITALPLGNASTSAATDVFPYVDITTGTTKKMRLGTLINLPTMQSTFISGIAPISRGGTGQITSTAAINALLPPQGAHADECLHTNGTLASWDTCGVGTVTSVALSLPSLFDVTGSPITSSGTLTATLAAQAANTVFSGGASASATPNFRALVSNDIPSLAASKITSGTLATARGGTNGDSSASTGIAHVSSGTWSYSAVGLGGSDVSGTLTTTKGGTGQDLSASSGVLKVATGTVSAGTIDLSTDTSSTALPTSKGGTGQDLSASTGILHLSSGTASASAVALNSSDTSGFLPLLKGGTGTSAISAAAAFNALSPLTTIGDMLQLTGSGNVRLAGNTTTTKNFLTSTGTGAAANPAAWGTIANTDLSGITNTQLSGSAAISNANLATVATATFKGRTTAGTGAPEDLTATQATAILNSMVGDSGSGGTKGLVPAPASGDAAAGKFLKADATWAAAGLNVTSQASPSPTPTQNLLVPNSQATITTTSTQLLETGNGNQLANANFEASTVTTAWTVANATPTPEPTTIQDGKKGLKLSLVSGSGDILSQSITPTGQVSGQTWDYGMWVKTALTTIQLCALQAGSEVGACVPAPGDSLWHYLVVTFPAGSGTNGVKLKATSSSTGDVYADNGYAGLTRVIGKGLSVPVGSVFYVYDTTCPNGAIAADGSSITQTQYPALYAKTGATLPDARNVFIRGVNASTRTISSISYPAVTLGATVGDIFQGHYHNPIGVGGSGANNLFNYSGGQGAGQTLNGIGNPVREPVSDGTNGTPRTGTETRPVNLGLLSCIQAFDYSPDIVKPTQQVLPTVQRLTSSSGTYTTPAGVTWIEVEMVGGGGGGAGSGTAGPSTAGTGGTTTFGSSLLTATGGIGGTINTFGGGGGTVTVNSPAVQVVGLTGGSGNPSTNNTTVAAATGGNGGVSPFGGAGAGFGGTGGAFTGGAAIANTGSGGGGAGFNASASAAFGGSGGGAGGYIKAIITSPSATYAYGVGSAGTAGIAGTIGATGAAGGSGVIVVHEYYGGMNPPVLVSSVPTVTRYTTGTSQTYTVPTGVRWLKVKMVGGGGGGSGASTGGNSQGTIGGDSIFGTSLLTAAGGNLGPVNGTNGGLGGTPTVSAPAIALVTAQGGWGGGTAAGLSSSSAGGGMGGSSAIGGAGSSGGATNPGANGSTAGSNTGSGGGGGGCVTGGTCFAGGGGGSGAYIEAIIPGPLNSTYTYSVGTAGGAGTHIGSGAGDGGAGAAGMISIEEHYQ